MHEGCPSCGNLAVSTARKFFTGLSHPVECSECGAHLLAKEARIASWTWAIIAESLVWGGIIVAFFMWSWMPIIVAVGGGVALGFLRNSWAPLVTVEDAEIRRAARRQKVVMLVVLLLVLAITVEVVALFSAR
jgi:hypothetical protein